MRPWAVAAACLALLAAGCGGSASAPQGQTPQTKTLVVAVSAPLSRDAYLGTTIANGTRLGATNLVLPVSRDFYRLKIVVYDNAGSPSRAVANVRRAIAAGAVAIISDGTGIDASWRIANQAHVPIAIVYDGGTGLVDPRTRPNVFRIAPTNHGIAFRFAEYLVPKKLKVAFLTDEPVTGARVGRRSTARLRRTAAQSSHGSRFPRRQPTWRRRFSRPGVRVRPRCWSGPSPPVLPKR
jgi:ABC-type branched-subunit amino acid transport system substrate-binding protein